MISPQGYNLGKSPKNKNPFWDENGEDSSVNRIYATATVDDETGVPGVVTSKSVSGNDITFNFDFHNLKGERGAAGAQGPEGPEGQAGAVGATGAKGDQGERGPAGPEGPKGDTGETGAKGDTGEQGPQGAKGDTGATGSGVPVGGTAGQVLTKVDGTDYNTEWKDPTGGGSGGHVEWIDKTTQGNIYPRLKHEDLIMGNGSTGHQDIASAETYSLWNTDIVVTVQWGWDYPAGTKVGDSNTFVPAYGCGYMHEDDYFRTFDNHLGFYVYDISTNKEGVTATINDTYYEFRSDGFSLRFNIILNDGNSYDKSSNMTYTMLNDWCGPSHIIDHKILGVVE